MNTEPFNVNDLDQLSDIVVSVVLPLPDGREARVKLRTLTPAHINAIKRKVTWPKPPIKDFKKVGGEAAPIYDYQDPGYLQADAAADLLYSHHILVAALVLNISGETEEEKCAALEEKLGQYAYNLLISACNRINLPSKEDIERMMRSFRYDGPARTPDDDQAVTYPVRLERIIETGAG